MNHILEIINVNINDKQHHYNLILCTNIITFGIVQHQNLVFVSLIQTQLQFIVFNLKIHTETLRINHISKYFENPLTENQSEVLSEA